MSLKRLIICLAWGFIWFSIVGAGFATLMNYENTPGETLPALSAWPARSRIQPDKNLPTLIMALHPYCPCSRASIAELAELMRKFPKQVKAYILFYKPLHFADDWEKTDLWLSVERLPGTILMEDPDGAEAKLFNANISGHVLLYNHQGRLKFSGGITPGRGLTGNSQGRIALEKLLSAESPRQDRTPVFGCPIVARTTEKN